MTVVRRTRILIVDDSAVMRSLLRAVVTSEASFEVAGTAADGDAALRAIETLRPDLILLDVEMPVMDGLATLRELRARGNRAPVIMCSSLTQRGARVTIEALACGASDYVAKPTGQAGRDAALRSIAQELLPKIKVFTTRTPYCPLPVGAGPNRGIVAQAATQPAPSTPQAVAIGVSTGGPAALDLVLPALPAQFPLPVMVVQHMPELFTALLAERLNGRCKLRVREASEGDVVQAGTIYIARGNWHMGVLAGARQGSPATLHLTQGPQENHCRPAVDVLFRTAAAVYGAGLLGVILTGMGSDGLAGCRLLRGLGGMVLAQDQASSAVWGMPGAVTTAGLANKVLPLDAIAPDLLRLAGRNLCEARELRETVA